MKTALHRLLDFLESSRRSLFIPAVLLLSALVHIGASAQEQTVYRRGATQLENLLPPAPEAASAVKYVDVPFSHSEGLARLDIPIHTLEGRELSIPISLRYTSGGIKMDEIAGVAGLGWTLEAGGCVTRTVADMPDEFSAAGFGHRMPGAGLLSKLEDPADNSADKMSYLRDIVWHRLDASLDRYSYSVCGLTGSFVITDDGDVFHLSGDGTAVSYARDSTGAIAGFTLTGPDGTVYVLDIRETGRHDGSGDQPPTPTSGEPDRWTATTAWMLRTATSRSGLETAVFSYTEPREWNRDIRAGCRSVTVARSSGHETVSVSIDDRYIAESYSTKALESISLSGFTARFSYADSGGGILHISPAGQSAENYPLRLTGIGISYAGGEFLSVQTGTAGDPYDGRILLNSLRILRGGSLDDRWDFTYDTRDGRVSALSRDWFGYHNGEDESDPGSRGWTCPFSIDPASGSLSLSGGYPDAAEASYMSLLTADHDGASTAFTYEGNAVSVASAPGGTVSVGVRVKAVRTSDNGKVKRVRTFTYEDPHPDGPVFPLAEMYTTTSASLATRVLSRDTGVETLVHNWTIGIHENPVEVGPSIADTRVRYGRVTEDAGAAEPLTRAREPLRAVWTILIDGVDRSVARTVRTFDTDGVRAGWTQTFSAFPDGWTDDYTSTSAAPSSIDPLTGVRKGYSDSGPAARALLTRVEEYSGEEGGTFTLLASTDYTYAPVSRERVVTDYRAAQVMRRIQYGDLQPEDIYHFPVRTSSSPGSSPVSERRATYREGTDGAVTLTTSYAPRPDLSYPVRPAEVTATSGETSRSVRYTYPDARAGSDDAAELLAEHALNTVLGKEYTIGGSVEDGGEGGSAGILQPVDTTRRTTPGPAAKSVLYEYGWFTAGERSVLMPSATVELSCGAESWREDILSRDCLGNAAEVKERGKPKTAVLWCWNGFFPAAVIENGDLAAARAALAPRVDPDSLAASPSISAVPAAALGRMRWSAPMADAAVTTYTFSPGVGMTSSTDAAGVRTSYEYDAAGRLSRVKDADGNTVDSFVYDLLDNGGDGRRSVRHRKPRDSSGLAYSEDISWWNTLGVRLEDIAVAAAGDGRDLVTAYGSDFMLHDDARVWLPYPAGTDCGEYQDGADAAAEGHHGSRKAYTAKTYERSSRGRVVSTALPGYDGTHATSYTLAAPDSIPRLVWEDGGVADKGFYDPAGLSAETATDPDGRTSTTVTDHFGRTLATVRGNDAPTVYIYDSLDRLRAVAAGDGDAADTLGMWRYSYDNAGRMVSKALPGCARTEYAYDGEDRVRSVRQGDGVTAYGYDPLGRVTLVTFRKGTGREQVQERRFYDSYPSEAAALVREAAGADSWDGPVKGLATCSELALLSPEDSAAGTALTVTLYDGKERPVRKATRYPDGGVLVERVTYGFSGDVVSRTVSHVVGGAADSVTTSYSYDIRGRLRAETSTLHTGGADAASIGYTPAYDLLGRLSGGAASADEGCTLATADSFDLRQRLTARTVTLDGDTLLTQTFRHDSATGFEGVPPQYSGLITRKDELWLFPGGASAADSAGFVYDGSGRLSAVRTASGMTAYAYDGRGDIVSVDAGEAGEETYDYSEGGRLVSLQGRDGAVKTFAHDSLGRMTVDGLAGTELCYGRLGLTTVVRSGDTVRVRYSHLADGVKAAAVDGTGTGLAYRGPFVYRIDSTGAMTLESAACSGGRLTPAGALLHVTDNLGSVRAVVRGSDGAFLAARDFGVYGEESCTPVPESARTAIPQSLILRDGFTGQESQTPDFGLPYTDFGARLYSPALRRWLTPDPLSEKYLGVSPYAYCDGNPVSVIDDGGEDLVLVGRGNSSVTLKSDIVNLTVDVSRLGVDWQGNHTLQGDDVLGAALDVAGIFDPTGAADAANMSLQVSRGDYGDALVSAIGLIPYAGDFAKLTRAGKDIRIISGAVEAVSHSSGLRKNMVKALGNAPDGAQAHHVFPVKFKNKFENKFGIKIDDAENGVWLDCHKHLSGAWKYNKEWDDFFEKNPNATKEDVMEFARKLMVETYGETVNF